MSCLIGCFGPQPASPLLCCSPFAPCGVMTNSRCSVGGAQLRPSQAEIYAKAGISADDLRRQDNAGPVQVAGASELAVDDAPEV